MKMDHIYESIRWLEQIQHHAVVMLDHIAEYESNVSPMLYEGREMKAKTAIEALKKQIPQVVQYTADKNNQYIVLCPVCKTDLSVLIGKQGINYCPNCGQRLN